MTEISELKIGNAEGDGLTITMRGETAQIINVLIHGLPPEALKQLHDAIQAELIARKNAPARE